MVDPYLRVPEMVAVPCSCVKRRLGTSVPRGRWIIGSRDMAKSIEARHQQVS